MSITYPVIYPTLFFLDTLVDLLKSLIDPKFSQTFPYPSFLNGKYRVTGS